MPSKRDPSKQRRQAQNRAARDALAARKESAAAPKPQRLAGDASDASATVESSSGSTASGASSASGATTSGGRTVRSRAFSDSAPGTRWAFYCLAAAVVSLGVTFFYSVPVDSDGVPFSADEQTQRDEYRELSAADEADLSSEEEERLAELEDDRAEYEELAEADELSDEDQERLDELAGFWVDIDRASDPSERFFMAAWPLSVAFIVAVAVGGLALWYSRSEVPYKAWFRLLLVMAALAFLTGGTFLLLFPTIALGIAYYQNRKAHMPPPGEGAPPPSPFGGLFGGRRSRDAIDVPSTEAEPSSAPKPDEP